jgi:hypothetical protein
MLKAAPIALFLSLAAAGLVAYKVLFAGYDLEAIAPAVAYEVRTVIRLEGHDDPVRVRSFLPRSDDRQTIREESYTSGDLRGTEEMAGENRRVTWSAGSIRGPRTITVSYMASARAVRYALPPDLAIPTGLPAELQEDLKGTDTIQVEAPEIADLLQKIAPEPRTVGGTLRAIFDYTHGQLTSVPFKGTTDALTALRLREGSCNGKSRLFAALARRAGLPTRLLGGLILAPGSKRTSHQWVETWVNGIWVPFCPLNNHFAEIPARYLRLYTGDEVLFSHSSNVNFDYSFNIHRRVVARHDLGEAGAPPWASSRLWALLGHIGIPLELLRILVMLPLGATLTVAFRNVVGLRVFGTFLPALIAVACRETGLAWGLLGFGALLLLVGLARLILDRMNLLHTPKLAVMLTLVIFAMIGLSATAAAYEIGSLAYISLFPIAVTTLTTERFALIVQEEGWREAISVSFQTIIAVAACYAVMESAALQSVFLAFPELLLAVLAVDLWLGRWMGLRLTEYRRFGGLFGKKSHA